jgi:ABC-type glutathione transport system ATPase component
MHELKVDEEVSIVLISHNEYAIREFTTKCLVLERGKQVFYGDSESAISYYINSLTNAKTYHGHAAADMSRQRTASGLGMKDAIAKPEGDIIRKVIFRDSRSNETNRIYTGERLEIDFHYETSKTIKSPIFGINFYNELGLFSGFWNSYEKVKLPDICGQGCVRVIVDPCDLPVDSYQCGVVVCEEQESNVLEWKDLPIGLVVQRPNDARGFQKLKQSWKVVTK